MPSFRTWAVLVAAVPLLLTAGAASAVSGSDGGGGGGGGGPAIAPSAAGVPPAQPSAEGAPTERASAKPPGGRGPSANRANEAVSPGGPPNASASRSAPSNPAPGDSPNPPESPAPPPGPSLSPGGPRLGTSPSRDPLAAFSGAATPAGHWRSPTAPRPVVARPFGIGPTPWSPGHRGADLTASRGTLVLAPAAGVVTFVGTVVDRPVLVITHPGGLVSSIEPVTADVRRGEQVRAGQVVGRMAATGRTHCFPSTCLHWGVRDQGRYVDPLALLGAGARPVVLLPLSPD